MPPPGVPQYVLDHAPLIHLSSKDRYLPSSLSAHLEHTRPQVNAKDATLSSPPLTLFNLDQLNALGSDVYLTSYDDVSTNPNWLNGIKPDINGGTGDEKTVVVVVVEKGEGVVDAFFFYFSSFNWGGVVLENQLGDHVGDWEHNMIRFINGAPKYVWFSQHANGEAFTFECLKKDKSGNRPLVYTALGSHALYPTPGTHDHTLPNLNLPVPLLLVDTTDSGPLFDPLLSSLFYSFSPSTSTFTPYNPTDPTGFLRYRGRWGDQEYAKTDKRQRDLAGNKKYVGGPTGPADKGLARKEVWPESSFAKGQVLRTSLDVDGGRWKAWVAKLNCFGKKEKATRVDVSGKVV